MSEKIVVKFNDGYQLVIKAKVVKATLEAAERIAEEAKTIAQEEGHVLTGRYVAGIVVDPPNEKSRGTARVRSTDQKSSWMEFGTYNHPGYFILRTAANRLGYQWVKKGK